MRKIERQMLQAIVDDRPHWSKDNTRVERNEEHPLSYDVYLHGHKIAAYYPKYTEELPDALHINNCGYETNTTKSRLNVLIDFVKGCDPTQNGIFQKNWNWWLINDGELLDFPSNEWIAV